MMAPPVCVPPYPEDLTAGSIQVEDVSFEVRAGEILGIAGVEGNGQTQLVEAIVGLRKPLAGRIWITGIPGIPCETTHLSPRQITELGVAHIPEDRQREGLVTSFPVADNLVLNTYYQPPFAHGPFIDEEMIQKYALKLVQEFDVRTPSIFTQAGMLSGGNQQKTVVAREFSRPIKLLVAAQPTRGLDVGSIEFIHRQIVQKRDGFPAGEKCAILLVSADLDEIISLSDRIAVMYRGRILEVLDQKTATRERLGLLMAGITPPPASGAPGTQPGLPGPGLPGKHRF
ncbi:MAG: ATP-binding cassette domain-containing protein [Chloroflexi bacterium]|nr:ATP-binding cassette domain-containing protein [Chloroflexota bacterium]